MREGLNRDHLDLLRAFIDADVRFLVVGAHAVGYHAQPRATGDLDLWIEKSGENARRVHEALRSFGAPVDDLSVADLATPGIVFQMGVVPNRIDVMNDIDGVTFEEAWTFREEATLGELRVPVIGVDALLTNKKATARPKDAGDVDAIERALRARKRSK